MRRMGRSGEQRSLGFLPGCFRLALLRGGAVECCAAVCATFSLVIAALHQRAVTRAAYLPGSENGQ